MLRSDSSEADMSRSEDARLPIVGADDEFVVANWVPGILPTLAQDVGITPGRLPDLPSWLKFPANATAGSIVYPAFDFLAWMARERGDSAKLTCTAYAYDLRAWFEFSAMEQTPWDEVTQETVQAFVSDMARAVLADDVADPDEGTPSDQSRSVLINLHSTPALAQNTIKRRMATLSSFYRHALSTDKLPFDRRTGSMAGSHPLELVRPIPLKYLSSFVDCLGPRPSRWSGVGTSRLWCCAMLAMIAGLRRIEVCGLDVDQIRSLKIDRRDRMFPHAILLRVAKGGRKRSIMLPTCLVEELLIYIDGERKASASSDDGPVQPIFANHAHARRSPHQRLAPATLSLDFRNAMLTADIRRMHLGFQYGTGPSLKLHTFHDLRHTCACLLYLTYFESQNPWLEVQNRLGHKLLSTTTDIYGRHINEFRERAINFPQALVDEILSA